MSEPSPSTIAHLDALTATGADGFIVLSVPMPERPRQSWASWSFPVTEVDAAAQAAHDLDVQGRNVYVRTNLLAQPLPPSREGWSWKRGTTDQVGAAVALTVDLDVAGPGHNQGQTEHPLPPDLDHADRIVAELPPPSLRITTGGGLHLWWLLEEPDTDDPVGLLDAWADRIVEAGRRSGYHVDRPDPARVLRVSGTHRRKPNVAVNRVELGDVAGWPAEGLSRRPWCPGGRYGATELLDALPEPLMQETPAPRPGVAVTTQVATGRPGPADAVSLLAWADILEPLGWTRTDRGGDVELWRRPGEPTSPYSMKCWPDGPAVVWSDACGLPAGKGQKLNRWKVYVALRWSGDEKAAGRAIRQAVSA